MKKGSSAIRAGRQKVLRFLRAQQRVLAEAGADADFMQAYAAALEQLARPTQRRIERDDVQKSLPNVESLSLGELEKIVLHPQAARRVLETIAVSRFHVPHGSLQSYSNIQMLKDKILTRIRNERTHQTISSVARKTRT